MNIYFVWGFLGSGKTTFINYLLENVFYDKRVVIIENESGVSSVDGTYLSNKQFVVKELTSGCACCTLQMDLIETIKSVEQEYSPDIIIVELSGIASLESVYRISGLKIDGVFSLLDVSKYKMLMNLNESFYNRQYSISPVIILTKNDLISDDNVFVSGIINKYSKGSVVINDYKCIDYNKWNEIIHKSTPIRWISNYRLDWDFCFNVTYLLDDYINSESCISLVHHILKVDKTSIFRAKGLMYNKNGVMSKYDIWEDSYSCLPLDNISDDNEVKKQFLTIWWNKDVDSGIIEFFNLFFNVREFDYKFALNNLKDEEIWSYMGGNGFVPSPDIVAIIEKMKKELVSICFPKFGFRIFKGELLDNGQLKICDKNFNPKGIIRKCFVNCNAYTFLVASIGDKMDKWIAMKHKSDDIMESYIADALGSVVVESAAGYASRILEKIVLSVGWKITNSYSPGYCGWNVSEQQFLFSMLPSKVCGIELSESSLMLPIKSVSAVVGLGENVEKKPYGCDICKKKDCYKRKVNI